jgi:phage terminase Nu1 subunit (DNA packaging protein)
MTLMTPAQLAVMLSVSVRQVDRCAAAGMPSVPVGARAKRYDPEACVAWLTKHGAELAQRAPAIRATRAVSISALNDYTAASRRTKFRIAPSK